MDARYLSQQTTLAKTNLITRQKYLISKQKIVHSLRNKTKSLLDAIFKCSAMFFAKACDQKQLYRLNETKSHSGGGVWNMSGYLIRPFLGLFGPLINPIR